MKVLGAPTVRPDAVLALARFLDAHPSEPSQDEVAVWMAPGIVTLSAQDKKDDLAERAASVRRVAVALGLVDPEGYRLLEPPPPSWETFGDLVHARFIERQEYDVFDTYASMVVEVEREGTEWLRRSAKSVVTVLEERVKKEDRQKVQAVFNYSRWPAWRAWVTLMGLGLPGPDGIATFFPHPAARLERVVRSLGRLAGGAEMRADLFVEAIGKAMPYLDHGPRYEVAWFRVNDRPAREVSRVLSQALIDLDRRGVIALRYEGGDREGARRLADGAGAFATVRLVEVGA